MENIILNAIIPALLLIALVLFVYFYVSSLLHAKSYIQSRTDSILCEVKVEYDRFTHVGGMQFADYRFIHHRIKYLSHSYRRTPSGYAAWSADLSKSEAYFKCLRSLYSIQDSIPKKIEYIEDKVVSIEQLLTMYNEQDIKLFNAVQLDMFNQIKNFVLMYRAVNIKAVEDAEPYYYALSVSAFSKILHLELF